MKTAFCFDLDGTVTTTEILPCIASELGVADEIAALTRLTMDGHVPFVDSMRLRCLILGQVPIERVHAVIDSIPLESTLVDFIDSRPDQCFIVTGNLDIWLEPLRRKLPCEWISSRARIADGRLKLDHILDKGAALADLRARQAFSRYVAVGDGANDAPMLAASDIAIAYGGVHTAARGAADAANLLINSPETLCNLLKAL